MNTLSLNGDQAALSDDIRAGKQPAFRILLEQGLRRLGRQIQAILGPGEDIEDVLQEVLIRAFNSRETLRGSSPWPWLAGITRNCCIDLLRKRTRRPQHADLNPETLPSQEIPLSEEFSLPEMLQALVPEDRELLVLRIVDGFSFEELSVITGRTSGALRVRVCSLMKRLRGSGKNISMGL